MAKQANQIVHLVESNEWKILGTDSKGIETTKDTIPDVKPMGEMESIGVFQNLISKETDARRATLSLLCHIWRFARNPAVKLDLKKYMGKGDKKTGQLGSGIKDDFKLAEDLYFKQFLDKDHPGHKGYMAQLPKLNERSEVLAEDDKHSYFLTRTRKSPSYANGKNLFLNYMAFVGHEPFTESDDGSDLIGIEPPEVMRARVSEAKNDVPAPDNSWEKRMTDLIRQLVNPDDPTKPLTTDGKKLPGLIQDMKACMSELEKRLKHYRKQEADLAAIHAKYHPEDKPAANEPGSGVPGLTDAAIEKAQQSTGRVKKGQNALAEKVEPVKG